LDWERLKRDEEWHAKFPQGIRAEWKPDPELDDIIGPREEGDMVHIGDVAERFIFDFVQLVVIRSIYGVFSEWVGIN
jgi:hypothetical protein